MVDLAPQPGVQRGGNPGNAALASGTPPGSAGLPSGQDMVGVAGIDSFGSHIVSGDTRKPSYRYSVTATAPVATPTAFIVIQGSPTRTIRIKHIGITGGSTAAGNMYAQINRRSSAGTLGSAVLTAVTAGKHDINDPAATATVSTVGTANYGTLGTLVAQLGSQRVALAAIGTGTNALTSWDLSRSFDKAWVLRGASDFITVDFNGQTVPSGGVIDFEIQTEEDLS